MRLLAPHTHEPRDGPRYGALSLLQKPLHYRGIQKNSFPGLNGKLCDLVRCACCMAPSPSKTFKVVNSEFRKKNGKIPLTIGCWPFGGAAGRAGAKRATSPHARRQTPAPGRAAGGPRRSLVLQAQAAEQRFKQAPAPARPRRRYIAAILV